MKKYEILSVIIRFIRVLHVPLKFILKGTMQAV
jgi:hypothetical protein